jgi:hypothetical protein
MSAFVVSQNHIDAIVMAAWLGPNGCERRTWYAPEFYRPNGDRQQITELNVDEIGRTLWTENIKSVQYRYADHEAFADLSTDKTADYQLDFMKTPKRTAAELLSLIHCYEYQSCEHPEWKTSAAKRLCRKLRESLEHYVPGYDEAPWMI